MYIQVDNNGWAKNTATGTQSKQEELNKDNYWTELYIHEHQELDEEGNIISTTPSNLKLLKLENNQIVLKTQADRDVYNTEQEQIKFNQEVNMLSVTTKKAVHDAMKDLDMLTVFNLFKQSESYDLTNEFDLNNPEVQYAIANYLPTGSLDLIKEKIIEQKNN